MPLDIAISIIINSIVLSLIVGGTGIFIWRLKLGSKNDVLLFILFIVYWMAPLMCREYTGQMHIAMNNRGKEAYGDNGAFLWLPLTVYGLAGLIYRPLTDILSYKLKSRKNLIYISLVIQFGTMLPMFFVQTLATNIIQSIGTGIGASIIGLFNLMFSEEHHNKKIFRNVSIMALPPLIAELSTGCIEAIACSFLKEQSELILNAQWYLDTIKYLWIVSAGFVVIAIILTILIKENKQLIFSDLKLKEPVKNKHDWTVVILIGVIAILLGYVRWIAAGPTSLTQFVYLGEIGSVNAKSPVIVTTKYMEGYLSIVYALGQLFGIGIASAALSTKNQKPKLVLVIIGCALYFAYFTLISVEDVKIMNAYVYFASHIIAGLAYGLIFPVIIGIMLNKNFNRVNIITPVGIFNTGLAVGITAASVFNNIAKGRAFDMKTGWMLDDFIPANHLVNSTTVFIVVALMIMFIIAYKIHVKYPPEQTNIGVRYRSGYEMEI